MSALVDPVTDADLDAYVDDQLDVTRRIEVEAFLSTRPEAAARVMSEKKSMPPTRIFAFHGFFSGSVSVSTT